MKYIIQIFVFFIINFTYSFSQTISFSEIDVSNFPNVITSFMALDAYGNSYTDLTTKDFEVYENGIQIDPKLLQLNCKISPMKVVLVFDKSTSMLDMVDTIRKWDWVVEGANSFINDFQYTNGSEIAITTFGGQSYFKLDFTNDKKLLYDSIKSIIPYGKTNFNAAFLGPYTGAIELLKNQPPNFRRIIVFLTDGQHDDPENPSVMIDSISHELINNNIQVYAITFLTTPNKDLDQIAANSGGESYVVTNEKQLSSIYSNIADKIKDRILCTLSWQSSQVCDEIERWKSVTIRYLRHNKTIYKLYQVPEQGVARLHTDEVTYKFGNPPIGSYNDVDITLNAENSPSSISNISITPSTYFQVIDYGDGTGSPPNYPVNIGFGGKLTLKVRFTPQGLATFRKANLQITADPCSTIIPIVGGIPDVFITKPIENDIYSMCDSIDIQWQGVDSFTPTDIFYSLNQGLTWTTITRGAKNNSYKWKPGFEQQRMLIKTEVSPTQTYVWAMSGGGKLYDKANGIALSKNQDAVYICGYLSAPAIVTGIYVGNKGGTDAFIAKYDIDGNLQWIHNDGSSDNDSSFSLTVDNQDNIYYVGTTYSGAKFGNVTPIMQIFASPYLFIAKYAPNGSIITANAIGANNTYPYFKAFGRSVKMVGNNVQVVGEYLGTIKIGNTTLPQANSLQRFTATFDQNLTLLSVNVGGTIQYVTKVTDKDKFDYEITNFTYYRDFDRYTVKSEGSYDYALTKFGLSSEGFDISDPFDIYKPVITSDLPNIDMGICLVGDTCKVNFPNLIKNPGKVPSTITGYQIIGNLPYTNYITIDSSIIGKTLLPDEATDLQVTVNSYTRGDYNVNIRLFGDCAEEVVIPTKGYIDCQTMLPDTIDFGDVFVGTTKTMQIDTLLWNMNGIPLIINPVLQGKNPLDYNLIKKHIDTVAPKEAYPIDMSFSPQQLGPRTARINLLMKDQCGGQIIYVKGVGINPNAVIPDEVDWKTRRINKNYDSTFTIYNPSTSTLQLIGIKWKDAPTNSEFYYQQNLPIDIQPQTTIQVPVSFYPTDDISYQKELILTIQNKDSLSEFPVKLKGQGFYPQLTYSWDCGNSVKPGETTTATLSVTNTSNNSVLSVNRIILASVNTVYNWVAGTEPKNETILPHETKSYLISFTPPDTKPQLNTIVIMADDFDGKFVDFWKETRFDINCQAMGVNYPSKIDFGTNLICTNKLNTIKLKNESNSVDIELDLANANIIGDVNSAFTLIDNNKIIIQPSKEIEVNVKYNPTKPAIDTALLVIPNNFGIDITIKLTGIGKKLQILSDKTEYEDIPGKVQTITLRLKSDALENPITKLKMVLNYNDKQILFDANYFEDALKSNWNWDNPDFTSKGQIILSGSGIIQTPINTDLLKLKYTYLLDTGKVSDLIIKTDYSCNNFFDTVASIRTLPVCLDDRRNIIVKLDNNSPILELVSPNPTSNYFTLRFSSGSEFTAVANLYNTMGEKVMKLLDKKYKSGLYEEKIYIENLQPGLYFIEFGDGISKEYQKIVITK